VRVPCLLVTGTPHDWQRADERTTDTSSTNLLRRNWPPFGQKGDAFPQARPLRLRHPFSSRDLGGVDIPASIGHLGGINHATGLSRDAVNVDTVEHLLAALVSLGVDNVIVELNSPEVPIMDGSAAPFIYLIHEAGIKRLPAARRYMKILRPLSLTRGDKRIAVYPSDHFKVTYSIAFDHPLLRHQSRTIRLSEDAFTTRSRPRAPSAS